jgi:hypothetical protein
MQTMASLLSVAAMVSAMVVISSGVGLDDQVGTVAVLAALPGLVGVRASGSTREITPLGGDLAGDAPAAAGAIGALGGLDVLAGHQREQGHRLTCFASRPSSSGQVVLDPGQHRPRVGPAPRPARGASSRLRGSQSSPRTETACSDMALSPSALG